METLSSVGGTLSRAIRGDPSAAFKKSLNLAAAFNYNDIMASLCKQHLSAGKTIEEVGAFIAYNIPSSDALNEYVVNMNELIGKLSVPLEGRSGFDCGAVVDDLLREERQTQKYSRTLRGLQQLLNAKNSAIPDTNANSSLKGDLGMNSDLLGIGIEYLAWLGHLLSEFRSRHESWRNIPLYDVGKMESEEKALMKESLKPSRPSLLGLSSPRTQFYVDTLNWLRSLRTKIAYFDNGTARQSLQDYMVGNRPIDEKSARLLAAILNKDASTIVNLANSSSATPINDTARSKGDKDPLVNAPPFSPRAPKYTGERTSGERTTTSGERVTTSREQATGYSEDAARRLVEESARSAERIRDYNSAQREARVQYEVEERARAAEETAARLRREQEVERAGQRTATSPRQTLSKIYPLDIETRTAARAAPPQPNPYATVGSKWDPMEVPVPDSTPAPQEQQPEPPVAQTPGGGVFRRIASPTKSDTVSNPELSMGSVIDLRYVANAQTNTPVMGLVTPGVAAHEPMAVPLNVGPTFAAQAPGQTYGPAFTQPPSGYNDPKFVNIPPPVPISEIGGEGYRPYEEDVGYDGFEDKETAPVQLSCGRMNTSEYWDPTKVGAERLVLRREHNGAFTSYRVSDLLQLTANTDMTSDELLEIVSQTLGNDYLRKAEVQGTDEMEAMVRREAITALLKNTTDTCPTREMCMRSIFKCLERTLASGEWTMPHGDNNSDSRLDEAWSSLNKNVARNSDSSKDFVVRRARLGINVNDEAVPFQPMAVVSAANENINLMNFNAGRPVLLFAEFLGKICNNLLKGYNGASKYLDIIN